MTTACWGWGRSPYWWDSWWPPHTCRGWGRTWGQTWWDLWWKALLRMWHDWHYTEGWGNLGTITVAAIAIISSALYNRRTLRQARAIADATLALTRRQRADTRGDVLRTELSRWLTVVSEIERTFAELFRRTWETNRHLQTDENDNPLDAAEIRRRVSKLKSAVSQELSGPLTNYDTQRTQIHMLTADEIIVTNMHFITQAIIGKRQNLNKLIDTLHVNANRTPDEEQRDFLGAMILAPAQDHQYNRQITASRGDLINHVIASFNPAAVRTAARVIRNYPDVLQQLQPTSVIVPQPQPQPQPQPRQPPPPQPQPPQPPPLSAPASPPDVD